MLEREKSAQPSRGWRRNCDPRLRYANYAAAIILFDHLLLRQQLLIMEREDACRAAVSLIDKRYACYCFNRLSRVPAAISRRPQLFSLAHAQKRGISYRMNRIAR